LWAPSALPFASPDRPRAEPDAADGKPRPSEFRATGGDVSLRTTRHPRSSRVSAISGRSTGASADPLTPTLVEHVRNVGQRDAPHATAASEWRAGSATASRRPLVPDTRR